MAQKQDALSIQIKDPITADGIMRRLQTAGLAVAVQPEVTSTNTLLRQQAKNGAKEGSVLFAQKQTGGRGRLGRAFFSPADTGIYGSILLRPQNLALTDAAGITTMAAVSACEAIEAVGGENATIKWVNDIFMRGKKVCGILTEGVIDPASANAEFLILGVGMNVYPPPNGFPPELKNTAGAIFCERQPELRNRLAAAFLDRFFTYYQTDEKKDYPARYRNRCFVLGQKIRVIRPDSEREATALDTDEACRLLVEYPDGTREFLASGEISIRPAAK